MRIFRGLPAHANGPIALTIGNFDGVHRGHQAMLARLCEAAADLRLPPAVLTFDPHPREFFAPQKAPPRLLRLRQKLELFRMLGVAQTYVARFDATLAALSPDAFIADVLVRRLAAQWVLVGDDFRFGHARVGNLAVLRAHAATFSVEGMRTVVVDGDRASSTAVRQALAAGDLARATALLGRPFTITGRVAHGQKLGRKLGFPTANIELPQRPPLAGIFAVRIHGLGAAPRTGVASLGVRPTIATVAKPLLEVFVFDFDENIYGRRVTVEFLHKLRDEEKYDDLDSLTRQIRADVAQARSYFATAHI
ncbi:MAG: bifunctional riboflavin kinase/FAD synthetase [Betaproteobacteria bacterium]